MHGHKERMEERKLILSGALCMCERPRLVMGRKMEKGRKERKKILTCYVIGHGWRWGGCRWKERTKERQTEGRKEVRKEGKKILIGALCERSWLGMGRLQMGRKN